MIRKVYWIADEGRLKKFTPSGAELLWEHTVQETRGELTDVTYYYYRTKSGKYVKITWIPLHGHTRADVIDELTLKGDLSWAYDVDAYQRLFGKLEEI